jgi:hypothetical protein
MIPGTFPIFASIVRREIIFGGALSDATNQVTHTFSSRNFGDDDPSRLIVVAWLQVGSNAQTVTIGGVGATKYNSTAATTAACTAVAAPTGTSGSIVIGSGASSQLFGVYWIVYGMSSTPVDNKNSEDTVDPITNNASVSLVSGGSWFGFAHSIDPTGAMSGITNEFQTNPDASDYLVGGSELTNAAGTGTVSIAVRNRICALSLGPF